MRRKITAILAADVVGYSKLVGKAEEEAISRLLEYQQVFVEIVESCEGRIFNTAGDAILAEFASSVFALRAAIAIQEAIRTRNLAFEASRRMQFRIGMHVGDVIEQEGDLLGDAVNVAARLESIAEPGGICLSHTFYEQVADKVPAFYKDLGPRHLKNITGPVRAYSISLFEIDQIQAIFKRQDKHPKLVRLGVFAAATLIVIAGAGALMAIYNHQGTATSPVFAAAKADDEQHASSTPTPAAPVQTADAPPASVPARSDTDTSTDAKKPPTYQDIKGYCRTYTNDDIAKVETQGLNELEQYRSNLVKKRVSFSPEMNPNDAGNTLGYSLVFSGFYGGMIESGPDGWTAQNVRLGDVLKQLDKIDAAEKLLISRFRDPIYMPSITYLWMVEQGNCFFPDPANPPTADLMLTMLAGHNLTASFDDRGKRMFKAIYDAVIRIEADRLSQNRGTSIWDTLNLLRDRIAEFQLASLTNR